MVIYDVLLLIHCLCLNIYIYTPSRGAASYWLYLTSSWVFFRVFLTQLHCSIRFRLHGAPKARYTLGAISPGCLRTLSVFFNTKIFRTSVCHDRTSAHAVIGTQPMRRICVALVLFRSVCLSLRSATRRLAPHFSSWHSYSKRPIQLFGVGPSSGLQQVGPSSKSFIRVSHVAFGVRPFPSLALFGLWLAPLVLLFSVIIRAR